MKIGANGTQGYQENARELATQYESITFADVHRDVLHLFPQHPCRVLDIGAGSGRDAAALATIGHNVVAVEPTDALRREGMRLHVQSAIEWLDDELPHLAHVKAQGVRFGLILLTAVWIHLDQEERGTAMDSLVALLETTGRLSMSIRHGPVPPGRRMFTVAAAEVSELAQSRKLRVIHTNEREDMLGRNDVHWTFLTFEK